MQTCGRKYVSDNVSDTESWNIESWINLAAAVYKTAIADHDESFMNSDWGSFIKELVLQHAKDKLKRQTYKLIMPKH